MSFLSVKYGECTIESIVFINLGSTAISVHLFAIRTAWSDGRLNCWVCWYAVQFADEKTTWKILQQARQQQEELQEEFGLARL